MNEDIVYRIKEFIKKKNDQLYLEERPKQEPFSKWAIDEIIYELQNDYVRYPDEIIKNYIRLMITYEEYAEIERKLLYRTARKTAEELYSYLFE